MPLTSVWLLLSVTKFWETCKVSLVNTCISMNNTPIIGSAERVTTMGLLFAIVKVSTCTYMYLYVEHATSFACLHLSCELVNLLFIGTCVFRTYSLYTSIGDFRRFLQASHQFMASFWNWTPRWRYHTEILGTKREWEWNNWTSCKANSFNCRLELVVSWAINFPSIYNYSYYYYFYSCCERRYYHLSQRSSAVNYDRLPGLAIDRKRSPQCRPVEANETCEMYSRPRRCKILPLVQWRRVMWHWMCNDVPVGCHLSSCSTFTWTYLCQVHWSTQMSIYIFLHLAH